MMQIFEGKDFRQKKNNQVVLNVKVGKSDMEILQEKH
jgi:hypothetical protein